MKWILKKTKVSENDFQNIENKLGVKFPVDFKEVVLDNNGASPELMNYDTETTKERVAEYLVSFSENDKYNILDVYESIKDRFKQKLIPVMQDPFGNYICFDFSNEDTCRLCFWNHENNNIEHISNSFSEFLNILY